MELTVEMQGFKELETWLSIAVDKLEGVPEAFSKREDVKQSLKDIAIVTLDQFGIGRTHTHKSTGNKTGVASGTPQRNIKADSYKGDDGHGIVVYEDLNTETASTGDKDGLHAGENAYILFFLTDYAPQTWVRSRASGVFLNRDFYALWPEMMKPTVMDAFAEEIQKALGR